MKKILFLLIILLTLSACSSNDPVSENDNNLEPAKIINISAKRFEFTPSIIKVKQNEKITLKIDNTDTTHGIFIPELGLRDNHELTFTPTEKGTFEFRCGNPCGSGHRKMRGSIIVE